MSAAAKNDPVGATLMAVLNLLYEAGVGPNCAFAKPCSYGDQTETGVEITLFYAQDAAQADRSPKGHDPAEGHGRNDESPVAATSGDAPEGS